MKPALFAFFFLLASCAPPITTGNSNTDNSQEKLRDKVLPAVLRSYEMRVMLAKTQADALVWTEVPGADERKQELSHFLETDYPNMSQFYNSLAADSLASRSSVEEAVHNLDKLVQQYKNLTSQLQTMTDYNDPAVMLPVQAMFTDNAGDGAAAYKAAEQSLQRIDEQLQLEAKALLGRAAN